MWLYNTPEAPVRPKSSTPPSKIIKKEKSKKKEKIKKEPKVKREPMVKKEEEIKEEEHTGYRVKSELLTQGKRPRPVSAEMSYPKRSGLITQQQTKLWKELKSLVSEDNAEGIIEDDGSSSGLSKQAEGSEGEEPPMQCDKAEDGSRKEKKKRENTGKGAWGCVKITS